jgi:hypothetical protein
LEAFSLGSALYRAAERLSACLQSDPKLVESLWHHIIEPAEPPGAIVAFALLASRDEPLLIAEFIQGETIPGLAQRCDPAACEQSIPMFRRIFDAFEGIRNGNPTGSESPVIGFTPIRAGHFELIELGIAQIRAAAIGGSGSQKLHGSVVVTPTRLIGARVFSAAEEETHVLDATSVQLYQSLAMCISAGTQRASGPVVFWCLSDLRNQPMMTTAPALVVTRPSIGMPGEPAASRRTSRMRRLAPIAVAALAGLFLGDQRPRGASNQSDSHVREVKQDCGRFVEGVSTAPIQQEIAKVSDRDPGSGDPTRGAVTAPRRRL